MYVAYRAAKLILLYVPYVVGRRGRGAGYRCCSRINSSLKSSPWSQDRLQQLWSSGRLLQGAKLKIYQKIIHVIPNKQYILDEKEKVRSAYPYTYVRLIYTSLLKVRWTNRNRNWWDSRIPIRKDMKKNEAQIEIEKKEEKRTWNKIQ